MRIGSVLLEATGRAVRRCRGVGFEDLDLTVGIPDERVSRGFDVLIVCDGWSLPVGVEIIRPNNT